MLIWAIARKKELCFFRYTYVALTQLFTGLRFIHSLKRDDFMEKVNKSVNKKGQRSMHRKRRYGLRKLSVGLVSCALRYIIIFPNVV